jgi:hypothetical protein
MFEPLCKRKESLYLAHVLVSLRMWCEKSSFTTKAVIVSYQAIVMRLCDSQQSLRLSILF